MSVQESLDMQLELLREAERRLACSLRRFHQTDGRDEEVSREVRRNFLLAQLHVRMIEKAQRLL